MSVAGAAHLVSGGGPLPSGHPAAVAWGPYPTPVVAPLVVGA